MAVAQTPRLGILAERSTLDSRDGAESRHELAPGPSSIYEKPSPSLARLPSVLSGCRRPSRRQEAALRRGGRYLISIAMGFARRNQTSL